MSGLRFVKMVASGNDFVVMDSRGRLGKGYAKQAQILCERRTGIGADGLLILEDSKKADLRMRIFNADGSEAEMCGNGLGCTALYACKNQKGLRIETEAGIYEASVTAKDRVKIKMEEPKDLKLDVQIKVNARSLKVNYVDTGVPHVVIFVQGLDGIDVEHIGRDIRYHNRFKPRGTNVDFVEIIDDKKIKMRTYERGVEGETLACGTGAVASAVITAFTSKVRACEIDVYTKGGVMKVYFNKLGNKIRDVYLEGNVREVYKGEVSYV